MVFADDVIVPLTKEGPVEKAAKLLDDNPTMKNSSAAFNYLCAELFARGAEYEKAAACYRRALPKVDPAQPLADELHLSLGDALRRMGKEDEALDRFRKIPTGRDKYVSAAIAMAFIHMDRDEFDKAHGLVRDLVAMQPDNVWLHGVAARIKARQFGLDKGIEALKSSAKKHGFEEHPIYRRTLAGMLIRQKNYDEAIATLNEALANERLNERVRHDLREMLAHTHDAAGQDDKAEALYRENLEQAPEGSRATAANGLAYFYAQRGKNLDEAEVLVKSSLKVEPANYAYIDTLGWVYYKQGRLEEALEELRRAEALSDGDGEILKHLAEALQKSGKAREAFAKWVAAGDAYAGEGQSDEARKAYEQALAIDEAPGVRTKLEKLTKDSTAEDKGDKN
jgi:tetratricopeptide (TPR) repeat protein